MRASILRHLLTLTLLPFPGIAEVDDNGPLDGSDVNDAPDVFVKIEAVPLAAVQELRAQAGGIEFDEVELDLDYGAPQYALQWESEGQIHEATVGAEGHLIKRDEKLVVADTPEPVRRVVLEFFPVGIPLEVEHTTIVTYEVKELGQGDLRKLEIHPIGRVLDTEGIELPESVRQEEAPPQEHLYDAGYLIVRSIETDELPEAVHRKLTSKAETNTTFTTIKQETYTGSSTYKSEWLTPDCRFEAVVSNDGELLEESHSVLKEELPSGVRTIIDTYFPQELEREYSIKLTSRYDIDTLSPTLSHQLILDPSGNVLEASSLPDRVTATPSVQRIGHEIVVTHQALLGFPKPHLEVSYGPEAGRNWAEVPMRAIGDSLLEVRLPVNKGSAFFRIRLGE